MNLLIVSDVVPNVCINFFSFSPCMPTPAPEKIETINNPKNGQRFGFLGQ